MILFIAHIAIIISSALMRLFDSSEKIIGKTSQNNPLFLNNSNNCLVAEPLASVLRYTHPVLCVMSQNSNPFRSSAATPLPIISLSW